MLNKKFWSEQRVFLTGHTGFKGSWLSLWLAEMGAQQCGYSLAPDTTPNLHTLIGDVPNIASVINDIRDKSALDDVVSEFEPTVAIHMAAQPLVRKSYAYPIETYDVNVMGTLKVLDSLRRVPSLKAVLVVTTDKVYQNDNSGRAFKETDALGGHDPYSSSKAACEEVVSCYRQSYFDELGIPLVTARAGNVVGGGDWSEDRLVPDIWRAMLAGTPVTLRNPASVRPWQHVLDPLSGYLKYIEYIFDKKNSSFPHALNFAPAADKPMTVQEVTELLGNSLGLTKVWEKDHDEQPVEMKLLTLDAGLAASTIGWAPSLNSKQAIEWSAEWYLRFNKGESALNCTIDQIKTFESRW